MLRPQPSRPRPESPRPKPLKRCLATETRLETLTSLLNMYSNMHVFLSLLKIRDNFDNDDNFNDQQQDSVTIHSEKDQIPACRNIKRWKRLQFCRFRSAETSFFCITNTHCEQMYRNLMDLWFSTQTKSLYYTLFLYLFCINTFIYFQSGYLSDLHSGQNQINVSYAMHYADITSSKMK